VISAIVRLAVRYPKYVLGAWVAVVAGFAVLAIPVQGKLLPADLFIPGTQSNTWHERVNPEYGLAMADVIEGPPKLIDHYGPLLNEALSNRPLTRVQSPWSPNAGPAAARILRKRPDLAVFALDVRIPPSANNNPNAVVTPLENFIKARIGPLHEYLVGDASLGKELNQAGFEALHVGELIAVPLLIIVLLAVFRSPVAAAIPGAVAIGALSFSYGMLNILTSVTDLDIMALSLASMMGLALGIDYALLLVSRFREELDTGKPPRQAATLAANTAGRTAIFAGTVLSSLMIVLIIESPGSLLRSASIGAILSTAFAMTSALTFCPAIMTVLGPRVNMWTIGGRRAGAGPGIIGAIVAAVIARPKLFFFGTLGLVLLMAAPVLALKTTPPDPKQLPKGNPALYAYDQLLKAGLGPNVSIVLQKPGGRTITSLKDLQAVQGLEDEIARVPYVQFIAGPGLIYSKVALLRKAPAQIAAAKRELVGAHVLLNAKIRQVQAARRQLAGDQLVLVRGLSNAQALLNEGKAQLANASAGISQLGELATGLQAASTGASDLARGTQTVQSGATELQSALNQILAAINKAYPQIQSADKQIRTAQSEFGLLRVPAQIVEKQLRAANAQLAAATIGNADPAVLQAKISVATALAADTGTSPIPGIPSIPGYTGLANALAQAQSEAASAGNQADYAVRQVSYLKDALNQMAFGAGRLVKPGLSTIISGLHTLASGLAFAHQRVAAEQPQVAALAAQANALLNTGQAQLQQAGAQAFPQISQGLGQLQQAETQLTTVRDQLVSKTGPFRPLRELDTIEKLSPHIFSSPYLIVAALDGAQHLTKSVLQTIVDTDVGGSIGQVTVLPHVQTNSPQQFQVVDNIRALVNHFAAEHHFDTAVGGTASELVDYSNTMASRLPLIILSLCLVTYLMLVPILRSLVLPGIAVILNCLTVAVAMAVVTAAAVDGVVATHAPIGGAGRPDIVAVTAVFCVIFALSIDYYVFLLTRMREEYVRTQSNEASIQHGIEKTGKIVTGAAAIMIATFFAYSLTSFTIVKELGIGMFSAIIVDALLMLILLLPATMRLFGDFTWWMPRWLDEHLPEIDIEGAAFEHESETLGGGGGPIGAGAHA
jgi:RND superfamily putative drug exporter